MFRVWLSWPGRTTFFAISTDACMQCCKSSPWKGQQCCPASHPPSLLHSAHEGFQHELEIWDTCFLTEHPDWKVLQTFVMSPDLLLNAAVCRRVSRHRGHLASLDPWRCIWQQRLIDVVALQRHVLAPAHTQTPLSCSTSKRALSIKNQSHSLLPKGPSQMMPGRCGRYSLN